MAEVAGGIPMEQQLQARVWLPLDMIHTGFSIAADPRSISPQQQARGEGRYVSCGGGMESTLDDMAHFYQMLLGRGVYNGKRLLSEKLYADMISRHGQNPRMANDPHMSGEYGYGIYRDRVAADGAALTLSHGGSLGTMPWTDLNTGLVGVFFSQVPLRKVFPLIARVQAEARGLGATVSAANASLDRADTPSAPGAGGQGSGNSERTPDPVFNKMSGGASVINLKQFQEHIENETDSSGLKGQPDKIEQVFKRLDQNSNGVLTEEEYSQLQTMQH
jgi:CubicO group peptidase (beta-lactamase class C family)